MATNMKRVMLSIPPEDKEEIEIIKQKEYYDKSYAELYRYLLRLGLEKKHENELEKPTVTGTQQ